MKYFLFSPLVMISCFSFAQDCSKELLRGKPGTWKKGPQGIIHNINTADLAREKTVLDSIFQMIKSKYSPTGCQISYGTIFGKEPSAGENYIADPYLLSMYVLRFLCDKNSSDKSKYYVDVSTTTTVNVTVNTIYSLNNLYAANIPPDDFRGYLKLKQRPQQKNGVWFMGEEIVGDRGTPYELKEYRWLITYGDPLPFKYLNRREYLLIQKKRLEKALKDSPGEKDYTNQYIHNVNEYLKKPEDELNQPAIGMWNDEERFEKFVAEGTNGSFIAVVPNLSYYRPNLPKSSPQFFTVIYKIAAGDPVFEDNISAFQKAIDFSRLKNMLGK